MSNNKRKHPRVELEGLSIDVSDGVGFCSGAAVDISRFGMCLVNLSKRLGKDSELYTVVATTEDGKNFKFKVRPKWAETGMTSKTVGVEIDNAPWKWTEYVMSHEPANDDEDDVWGGNGNKGE